MKITSTQLEKIAGTKLSNEQRSNIRSIVLGLDKMGDQLGVNTAQRLAHFIGQLGHESGLFKYDREIWGNTPAQQRYDTRTDLGNTPERDGDGKKNAGRGPIQVTGGANIRELRDWCRKLGLNPPDFVANPDLINTDPWEGISALWYWSTRNLNRYADEGNIEMLTQKINGGRNGFEDRCRVYARAALVLLGRAPDALVAFQGDMRLNPDGVAGPATRAALHAALGVLDGRAAAPQASRETVLNVQARLRELGYPEVGNVDGKMGDRTEDAITAFRRRVGLPIVPVIDDSLLAALMTATPRLPSEERATATAADLKDAKSVKRGQQLKRAGQAALGFFGVGGLANGGATVEDMYNAYNKWTAFKDFASGLSPWLIGMAVGGVVIYFATDFIREQVQAYREGRHV